MTESDRGTGVSVPPPPPWAAPAVPPVAPGTPPAASGTPATPAATTPPPPPSPQSPHTGTGTATATVGYDRGPETVTVTSGSTSTATATSTAPRLNASPRLNPTEPLVKTKRGGNRPLLIVAIALAAVVVVAITLAVIPSGSPAAVTTPVGDAVVPHPGDDMPPPEDTVPTAPPSTAPPTTQALPPAQVVSRITTTDPVVFITIDDGWYTPSEPMAKLMSGTVPVTTFLLAQVLDKDPETWKGMAKASGSIENHSISHPAFAKLSLQQQQDQICTTSEDIAAKVGYFPTMFRPPYGSMNANTTVAAGNCGIKYVVKWGASVNKGKVAFASGEALRPGDIVLMHYRPELAEDLAAALTAAQAAGLKPALLTDYLK